MSTAIKPEDFASAGNYPAGANDWSAQPRKVALTTSEKAEGFTPNTPVGADIANGLNAELYEARSLLAYKGVQEWTSSTLPVTAGGRSCLFNFLVPVDLPSRYQRLIVASGFDLNDGNDHMLMYSYGSGFFGKTVIDLGIGDGALCVAQGRGGEFIAGGAVLVKLFSSAGAANADFITTSNPAAVHYMPGPNVYLAAIYVNGTFDRYAGNLISAGAGPFTNIPGPTGCTAFVASSIGTPGGEFADDGGNNVVYCGQSTIAGVTRHRLHYSTNAGLTWAVGLTFAISATANVVYSEALGSFVACDSVGFLYTSTNGVAWVSTFGVGTTNLGWSARHGTLACVGHCIAKAINPIYYGVSTAAAAIAYTFDLGDTWRVMHLADTDGQVSGGVNFGLRSLIGASGRFYATDTEHIYTSGIVAYDARDLTILLT